MHDRKSGKPILVTLPSKSKAYIEQGYVAIIGCFQQYIGILKILYWSRVSSIIYKIVSTIIHIQLQTTRVGVHEMITERHINI